MLKVASFNVNSVRQRLHQLEALIEKHQPDIIGLQETKVTDEEFPEQAIINLGYQAHFHGQKTHYGVALLSKQKFTSISKGFKQDDEATQRRLITGQFHSPFGGTLTVINGYFPQGESREHPTKFPNKKQFYADLIAYLKKHHSPSEQLIVLGDMNISPDDKDIGIGEDNRKRWLKTGKCSFLPEEREWLSALGAWGLHDTFRKHYPDEASLFSWFDYRSRGFERQPKRGLRIDFILATETLLLKSQDAGISYDIRSMEKPSDHCPVWTHFEAS
ncbi:MAG: exodeoxyribonuclease III [Pseudomonadota bacterium]